MNFEVGKYYITRFGGKAMCVHYFTMTVWFVVFPMNPHAAPTLIFTHLDGRQYSGGRESHDDIIGPWIDKPDIPWHLLPKCAVACAIDQGGTWHWFSVKPSPEGAWWTFPPKTKSGWLYPEHCPTWTGDWKDSLVERPKI